jgi:hypothetical protein
MPCVAVAHTLGPKADNLGVFRQHVCDGALAISWVGRDSPGVRYWDVVWTLNRTEEYVMTGSIKERAAVACIISMLLCFHSKGCGSIIASGHDYRKADLRRQE